MDNTVEAVRGYYDENARLEWERLEKHPFEFLLTTGMMERYIRPGNSVLDIGGGPGRYSIHFAQKGCRVVLAELSQGNVALAREKAAEAGVTVETYACDCLELDRLGLGQFDHVFLMGPLYHLQREEDRIRAVNLALKHLKPGGMLYVSFILTFAGVIYDLQNKGYLVEDLKNAHAMALLDAVEQGGDYCGPGFTEVYFYHQRNILPFMARFPLEKRHLFGQEGILSPNYREILTRSPEEIQAWVDLARRYLELPELLSYSEHAMYIGRKLPENDEGENI